MSRLRGHLTGTGTWDYKTKGKGTCAGFSFPSSSPSSSFRPKLELAAHRPGIAFTMALSDADVQKQVRGWDWASRSCGAGPGVTVWIPALGRRGLVSPEAEGRSFAPRSGVLVVCLREGIWLIRE